MSDKARVWLKLLSLVGAAVVSSYGMTQNWLAALGAGLTALGLFLDKGPAAIVPTLLASTLAPAGGSFAAGVAKATTPVPPATLATVEQVIADPVGAAEQAVSSLIGGQP